MIKLAISDLDGTLLTPNGELPKEIFSVVEKLNKKGILFGIASGRQLQNLKNLFAPIVNDAIFIAENGGLGYYKGELLFCNALNTEQVLAALKVVRSIDGLCPLLCAPDCSYYDNEDYQFVKHVDASYTMNSCANLEDVAKSNPICKIAIYDMKGAEKNGMTKLPALLPDLRIIQSGMEWIDISLHNANKGTALKNILEKIGISADECMAFGDHMNDLELLQACGHPKIMENSFYKLKEIFKDVIPSNAQLGVIQELKKLIKQSDKDKLKDKNFVFLGSSVTYGSASGGWSMCEYLSENFSCNVTKLAVSGTTLVDEGENSYIKRLKNNLSSIKQCDGFICQLSTNDAWLNKPLGTISNSFKISDFDVSTIIGGIEFIIATAQKQWNCPVYFYTGSYFDSKLYNDMVKALYKIKDKWNIDIIDLYTDEKFNSISSELYNEYMHDAIHPTKKGYELWWGEKFVESLTK